MVVQFNNAQGAIRNSVPVTSAEISCVRIGTHGIAQGELVWERGEVACIRVFSVLIVGRRV